METHWHWSYHRRLSGVFLFDTNDTLNIVHDYEILFCRCCMMSNQASKSISPNMLDFAIVKTFSFLQVFKREIYSILSFSIVAPLCSRRLELLTRLHPKQNQYISAFPTCCLPLAVQPSLYL